MLTELSSRGGSIGRGAKRVKENSMSQALVKVEPLSAPITQIENLRKRIEALQERAFVCFPWISLDLIAAGYKVSERVVVIDPNPTNGEVYYDKKFCGENEVALAKNGLLSILEGMNFTLDVDRCGRIDDRSEPYVAGYAYAGTLLQLDGTRKPSRKEKWTDLRDQSSEAKRMTPEQLA